MNRGRLRLTNCGRLETVIIVDWTHVMWWVEGGLKWLVRKTILTKVKNPLSWNEKMSLNIHENSSIRCWLDGWIQTVILDKSILDQMYEIPIIFKGEKLSHIHQPLLVCYSTNLVSKVDIYCTRNSHLKCLEHCSWKFIPNSSTLNSAIYVIKSGFSKLNKWKTHQVHSEGQIVHQKAIENW